MVFILPFFLVLVLLLLTYTRKCLFDKSILRVLMYHDITDLGVVDDLTINIDLLKKQFEYILQKGYTPILFSELISCVYLHQPLPKKPVLITFDDGYKNVYKLVYPFAEKLCIKINLFLVASFVENSIQNDLYLNMNDIQKMNQDIVEFGFHSYEHDNYLNISLADIDKDIRKCQQKFDELEIPCQPCFAYPYGAFPRRSRFDQELIFRSFHTNGIMLAFRIGNRINEIPFMKKYLIQRVNVNGSESFLLFKLTLFFGRKMIVRMGLNKMLKITR